ncbi:MAG: hypothetical protein D3906_13135, partial [Candidatus Electrothrix sp. AUS1_2]|nr:hypothetical protein [Candidatus Electrothrix sp. AUS1_2]
AAAAAGEAGRQLFPPRFIAAAVFCTFILDYIRLQTGEFFIAFQEVDVKMSSFKLFKEYCRLTEFI